LDKRSDANFGGDKVGDGGNGGGESHTPEKVDDGNQKRPVFDSGQICEIICGVSHETEKCPSQKCLSPYLFIKCRSDYKKDQSGNKNKIKKSGRPRDLDSLSLKIRSAWHKNSWQLKSAKSYRLPKIQEGQ